MVNIIDNFVSGTSDHKTASATLILPLFIERAVAGLAHPGSGELTFGFDCSSTTALDMVGASVTNITMVIEGRAGKSSPVSASYVLPIDFFAGGDITAGAYWRTQHYPAPPYGWSSFNG